MKKTVLCLMLLALLVPTVSFSQNMMKWDVLFEEGSPYGEEVLTRPAHLKLYDEMHFGFLDGSGIKSHTGGNVNRLIVTSDGGDSWETIFERASISPRICVQDWCISNENRIYILADSLIEIGYEGLNAIYEYRPMIMKSTDYGKTWSYKLLFNERRTRWSSSIYMKDSLNGIAVVFPNKESETTDVIFQTSDGWETWQIIPAPQGLLASRELMYDDEENISIISQFTNFLFYSSDKGANWTKVDMKETLSELLPSGFKFGNNTPKFHDGFIYFNYGQTISSTKYSNIFISKDNGTSWEAFFDNSESHEIFALSLSIVNDSVLFAHGGNTHFTKNRGKYWNIISPSYRFDYEQNINEIVMVNENLWIAVTQSGIAKYTGDSILQAPRITAPTTYFFLNTSFILEWTPIVGAISYDLEIYESEGYGVDEPELAPRINFDALNENDLFVKTSLSDTSFIIYGWFNKAYSCRVRAVSNDETSPWNRTYDFVTQKSTSIVYIEQNENILIYPNPSANYIEIKSNTEILSGIVQIFNSMGSEMLTRYYNEGDRIDISGLASGLYFVKIGNKVFKIMKK